MQRTLWATTWCNTLNAAFTLAITSSGHAHLCVPSENAWWQTDLSLWFWLHFQHHQFLLHLHATDGHNSWFSNTCFLPLNDACPQMDVGSSSWGCHCICEEALSRAFLPKRGPDESVSMHYCAPDCCLTKPLRTWMYKCVGLWRSCCISMALCCHVNPQFAYDVVARLLAEPKNDLSPSLFCCTSMQ